MRQVLGPGALGRPRGIRWRERWEGGSGGGIHVTPWLIHVNVWQNPLQCCEVISLQLIKINGKKIGDLDYQKKKKKTRTLSYITKNNDQKRNLLLYCFLIYRPHLYFTICSKNVLGSTRRSRSCVIFSYHVSLASLQPRTAPQAVYFTTLAFLKIMRWSFYRASLRLAFYRASLRLDLSDFFLWFYPCVSVQDVTAMKLCSFQCIAWGGMGYWLPCYSELTLMFGEDDF